MPLKLTPFWLFIGGLNLEYQSRQLAAMVLELLFRSFVLSADKKVGQIRALLWSCFFQTEKSIHSHNLGWYVVICVSVRKNAALKHFEAQIGYVTIQKCPKSKRKKKWKGVKKNWVWKKLEVTCLRCPESRFQVGGGCQWTDWQTNTSIILIFRVS